LKPRKKRKVSNPEVEDETGGELSEFSEVDVPAKSKSERKTETKKNGERASKGNGMKDSKTNVVSELEASDEEMELPKPAHQSEVTTMSKEPAEFDVKPDKIAADDSSS